MFDVNPYHEDHPIGGTRAAPLSKARIEGTSMRMSFIACRCSNILLGDATLPRTMAV